jgi:hypothetical protein
MPVDFSSDLSPSFREMSHAGLLLLKTPLVRSSGKLRRLRRGVTLPELPLKTARTFAGVR